MSWLPEIVLVLSLCFGGQCQDYVIETYTDGAECELVAAKMRSKIQDDEELRVGCEVVDQD